MGTIFYDWWNLIAKQACFSPGLGNSSFILDISFSTFQGLYENKCMIS